MILVRVNYNFQNNKATEKHVLLWQTSETNTRLSWNKSGALVFEILTNIG